MKRGANFTLSSVTCFVPIADIAQDEPADTYIHTFTVPLTAYSRYHYWYLTGTQGGQPMKSISQIFKARCDKYVYPPQTVKFYSAPGQGGDSMDGSPERVVAYSTWGSIHDGVQTTCYSAGATYRVGWMCSSRSWRYNALYRGKLTHNLTSIPLGSTILAAAYHFYNYRRDIGSGGAASFALFQCNSPSYNGCPSGDYQSFGTTPISNVIPIGSLAANAWHQFDILPAYFSLLPPGGHSILGMREATFDAPNIAGPWGYYSKTRIYPCAVEYAGSSKDPYLEITYQPP